MISRYGFPGDQVAATQEAIDQARARTILEQVWQMASTIYPQLISFELALDKKGDDAGDDWKGPTDFEKLSQEAMAKSILCAWRAVEHALKLEETGLAEALAMAKKFPEPGLEGA